MRTIVQSIMLLAVSAGALADATHCRTTKTWPGIAPKWRIHAGTEADFKSAPLYYFQITRKADLKRPTQIDIEAGDQFRIATTDGELRLVHSRAGNRVATAKLTIEAGGLWATGSAVPKKSTAATGKYFVFLLEDSAVCSHPNHVDDPNDANDDSCRQLHFEYFDELDNDSKGDLPEEGKNVVEITDTEECIPPMAETEDGDGDHGPD